MMALAESHAHGEMASVTLPMARTLGILAAKPGKAGGVVPDGKDSGIDASAVRSGCSHDNNDPKQLQ
jgi:hypothetical protein